MSSHINTSVAVYIMMRRGNQFLLELRSKKVSFGGYWQFPAGHIELEETPTEAIKREAREEMGIELLEPVLTHVSSRPSFGDNCNRIDYYFFTNDWKGRPVIQEPDKCESLTWFDLKEFPENLTPHVKEAFELMRKGEYFSELGMDFVKANYPTKK